MALLYDHSGQYLQHHGVLPAQHWFTRSCVRIAIPKEVPPKKYLQNKKISCCFELHESKQPQHIKTAVQVIAWFTI